MINSNPGPGGSAAPGIPLTAEDQAILALEGPTIVGHTCSVLRLGPDAPSLEALTAAVVGRLSRTPSLTRRLGGTADAPRWVPDDTFDITAHVGAVMPAQPLDEDGLRREVVRLFEQRLDRSRPLWRMDLVGPLADGGCALVWRLHHALADGTTAMWLAREVLLDPLPDTGVMSGMPPRPAAHVRRHLSGIVVRELLPSLHGSPFDARIGHARDVAFATTSLSGLRTAAHVLGGATTNDAVLAVTAGALRHWLEHRHGAPRDMRVKVPVSLHNQAMPQGNRDSYFYLALPVGEPDPVRRLEAVRAATVLRKTQHDAEEVDELLDRLGRAGPGLRHWVQRLQASPRTFALNVSNVPGPREEVHVLGSSVRAVHAVAELAPRHALRIAVVSVADRLCFGLLADPEVLDDLSTLAAAIERESANLIAAAAARQRNPGTPTPTAPAGGKPTYGNGA